MLVKDLEQAEAEIQKVFDGAIKLTPDTYKGKPGIRILRADQYAVPIYTGDGGLIGMLEIMQKACGGNRIEEVGHLQRSGCETCDWGSLYGIEYMVWEEQ